MIRYDSECSLIEIHAGQIIFKKGNPFILGGNLQKTIRKQNHVQLAKIE